MDTFVLLFLFKELGLVEFYLPLHFPQQISEFVAVLWQFVHNEVVIEYV